MVDEERDYFNKHPQPGISGGGADDATLTLWNFPVRKADVAPAHADATLRFAAPGFVSSSKAYSSTDFVVRGHASATGEEEVNTELALKRAQNVAAVLKRLGFEAPTEGVGSAEPAESGVLGDALARNRRVVVTRSALPFVPPSSQKQRLSPGEEVQVNLLLAEERTGKVMIRASMIGKLTVTMGGEKTPLEAGVVTTGPLALTSDFNDKLLEQLKPKLGFTGASDGGAPSINVGVEAEHWFQFPTMTYQDKPNFVYFNFKAIDARLPMVASFRKGADVHTEFSGSVMFEAGPAPKELFQFAGGRPQVNVEGAGLPSPLERDALVIGMTVLEAKKRATPLAQPDIQSLIQNRIGRMASRDGAASRVAWEVLNPDGGGEVGHNERQLGWQKLDDPALLAVWREGSTVVANIVWQAKGTDEEAKVKAKWEKYGVDAISYDNIRENVFVKLKGYDDDKGDLAGLIGGL